MRENTDQQNSEHGHFSHSEDFETFLRHKSLITIYKAFIRPHLDYRDILYDPPRNAIFCQKI